MVRKREIIIEDDGEVNEVLELDREVVLGKIKSNKRRGFISLAIGGFLLSMYFFWRIHPPPLPALIFWIILVLWGSYDNFIGITAENHVMKGEVIPHWVLKRL